jgi:hypothetical protein
MISDGITIKEKTGYKIGKLYISKDGTSDNKLECSFSTNEKAIFDTNSFNFHLYPDIVNQMKEISDIVGKRRKEIIEFSEKCNDVKIIGNKEFDSIKSMQDNIIYINKGLGSTGRLNPLNKTEYAKIKANGLFRFIQACRNGQLFCLNFMRFYLENDTINCILQCLQFEKVFDANARLNAGENNNCEVSYPIGNDKNKNSLGSYAYNPDVTFDAEVEVIMKSFINFIVSE